MAKSKSTNTFPKNLESITRQCVTCHIAFKPTKQQIRFENVRCDRCRDRTKKRGTERCASYASTMKYYAKLTPEQLEELRYRKVWQTMIARCHDEKYTNHYRYGGRGIIVCDRWRYSFEAFKSDMGPRPSPEYSIDRIDNSGPYSPENCRWATRKEQALNRRTNRVLDFNGRQLTLKEWSSKTGISLVVISMRLNRLAWSIERALTTPVKLTRPKRGN